MVSKKKKQSTTEKRGKGVNKPKFNKETVKELSHGESEKVQGGRIPATVILCISVGCPPPRK
jgi:hypothetical protein